MKIQLLIRGQARQNTECRRTRRNNVNLGGKETPGFGPYSQCIDFWKIDIITTLSSSSRGFVSNKHLHVTLNKPKNGTEKFKIKVVKFT